MLKIGTFDQVIPAHTQLEVEGQSDFVVLSLDDKGKENHMIGRSKDRHFKIVTRKDVNARFKITGQNFISVNARPVRSDTEDVSDIPYEIPDNNMANLTLEEKLKRYLLEMVEEKYGENSDEADTFEDAMDLDWEDDDPLAKFEPQPVIEEEPIEPDPPTEEQPTEEPPPEEPQNP